MPGISNHFDTMTFIKSLIDGLALSGLTGGSVIQEIPQYQDLDIPLPFVSISPWSKERMNQEPCPTGRDAVDYPTIIVLFAQAIQIDGQATIPSLELRLSWRQKIRAKLYNRSIPGLSENWNLVCEPQNIVEPKLMLDKAAFASTILTYAKFQEVRPA